MRGWINFCWVITILCTLPATVYLIGAFGATAAPAQAGAAVVACAIVLIPYVFTRAFDLWHRSDELAAIKAELARSVKSAATTQLQTEFIRPEELLAKK